MEKERLLEAPSIGMLSVLPNDADQPESDGRTKRRWRRSTFGCLNRTRSGPNRPAAAIGGADSLGHLTFELVDRGRLR